MSVGKKKSDARAVWKAMHDEASFDDFEAITEMSDEELDAAITAEGGDARAIREGSKELVRALFERRHALGWQRAMDAKLAAVRKTAQPKPALSRAELLDSIDRIRRNFPSGVAVQFHKKTLEASSDAELAAMLEELELLEKLSRERDDE